ncbi:MAG: peptidylprolyl isomerase [Candidatus Competibacteraceae bacterium]|jgi:peptidyl-prolyl cis-trans isomerase SurA|nr:peptidylprolyl isomerase [Candidatus Competibacteraceae bacterium]
MLIAIDGYRVSGRETMRQRINAIALGWFVFCSGAWGQLVFGPGPEDSGAQLDTIVAVVDDDVITRSELNTAVATVEQQFQQRGTSPPPQEVLENQILERLILAQLQLRAAERNGVVVDDQTLNSTIEGLAQQNNLTLSELRATLERDGIDFAEFREDIRRELLATRLRQRVVDNRLQISEQEVDNLLNRAPVQAIAQEYHIAQILIAVPEGATSAQLTAARDEANSVVESLRQGANFGSLAAAVSDGRQALEGGDLGWRSLEQLPTLFVDTVPRMQPGEISDPIRSPSGFHIVKVLETSASRAGSAPTTAELDRNQAREALFRRRAEEEWELWLRQLRGEAYVELRL